MTVTKTALFSAAFLALAAAPALADTVTFSLTTTSPTVIAGNTVTFSGLIAAPSSNTGDISLGSDSFTVDSPLSLDDSDYFNDTPVSLAPGASYNGALFTVTLPSSTAAGLYNGFFDISFEDSNSNPINLSNTFSVNALAAPTPAATTPEPGSWLLLSTGLAGVGLLRRRWQHAR